MKRYHLLLPTLIMVLLILPFAAGYLTEDIYFSQQENRILAQRPDFSLSSFVEGDFREDYENYLADQFPLRNSFITLKTKVLKLMGAKEANGVYFAFGNTLIECHHPEDVESEKALQKIERLAEQAADYSTKIEGNCYVMLVPTAAAVQQERLPAYAREYDQLGFLETVKETVLDESNKQEITKEENTAERGSVVFIDASGKLLAHSKEELYYGTDHHWTSLGAFYGYQAFCEAAGLKIPDVDEYERTCVTDQFYGTLQAKVNLSVKKDKIERFDSASSKESRVSFVYEKKESDSLYFPEKLKTKDAYTYFLGGNYPLLEIHGQGAEGRNLFLIKDSYANCLIPFLCRDYDTIVAVDPRYYRGDYSELISKYDAYDILYVFDIIHFIENYN